MPEFVASDVYRGSDGELTKAFYSELQKCGPIGFIAMNLFRAQKCSARAKVYRGGIRGHGSFKSMAYDRKNWSLDQLSKALQEHGSKIGISFGWQRDPHTPGFEWVLYVDLPTGQVSFHSATRYAGCDYIGQWDGIRGISERRICDFCDLVLRGQLRCQREEAGQQAFVGGQSA